MVATWHGRKLARWLSLAALAAVLAATYGWLCPRTNSQRRREPKFRRSYRVVTRADHDARAPAPVLFALHAYATAPDAMVRSYLLESLAVRARGYILVVPEGLRDSAGNRAWNASAACCRAGAERPDDLEYLRAVLVEVGRAYTVDPARVVAFGISNGGFMAYRWACAPGGELSAIVSIAGSGPGAEDPPCSPTAPVSVLHIHGDADEVIAYEGGGMNGHAYPSAVGSVAPFLAAAHVTGGVKESSAHAFLLGDLRRQEWSGANTKIALWTVERGPHTMPMVQSLVFDILHFLAPAEH